MIKIVEIPEKPSWTKYILNLKIGEQLKVPISKRSTVASRISGTIKDRFPERQYPTDAVSEPGWLIVHRIA